MYRESQEFKQHPLIPNGIAQTIVSSFIKVVEKTTPVIHEVYVDKKDKIVILEDRGSIRPDRELTAILFHPFASKARDPMLERIAIELRLSGVRVFRVNFRGAGEGRGKAKSIYHSASIPDVKLASVCPELCFFKNERLKKSA